MFRALVLSDRRLTARGKVSLKQVKVILLLRWLNAEMTVVNEQRISALNLASNDTREEIAFCFETQRSSVDRNDNYVREIQASTRCHEGRRATFLKERKKSFCFCFLCGAEVTETEGLFFEVSRGS